MHFFTWPSCSAVVFWPYSQKVSQYFTFSHRWHQFASILYFMYTAFQKHGSHTTSAHYLLTFCWQACIQKHWANKCRLAKKVSPFAIYFPFILVITLAVWVKLGRVPVKARWLVPEDECGWAASNLLWPWRPVHEERVWHPWWKLSLYCSTKQTRAGSLNRHDMYCNGDSVYSCLSVAIS